MRSPLKPWSKAQIRRVNESVHAGGFQALRCETGWVVSLSDSGSRLRWSQYFVPSSVTDGRHVHWLGQYLIAAMRRGLAKHEGNSQVGTAEARELVRWCVRHAPRRRRTSKRAKAALRWTRARRRAKRMQGGGYMVSRSRRGWVVELSSYCGSLRGRYVIPFRALRLHGRDWHGGVFHAEFRSALKKLPSARRISRGEANGLLNAGAKGNLVLRIGGTVTRAA